MSVVDVLRRRGNIHASNFSDCFTICDDCTSNKPNYSSTRLPSHESVTTKLSHRKCVVDKKHTISDDPLPSLSIIKNEVTSTSVNEMKKLKNETNTSDNILLIDQLITIKFHTLMTFSLILPFFSIFFCLFSSLIFKWNDVNFVKCNVGNFVPSISAVTGIFPQAFVWRIGIGFHLAPRFLVIYLYFKFYERSCKHIENRFPHFLRYINSLLVLTENICLILVTYVSNKDNYIVHERSFIMFLACSLLHNITTIILHRFYCPSNDESLRRKIFMASGCWISTAFLVFFHHLHIISCVPYAFSLFAFFEYILVIFNMGFHYSALEDFPHYQLMIAHPN
ncbi:hypothetical protein SNEBB_008720 [Seison nebaliae]|nr:hypothetical protein SNEBB_008720 [Seison nebaliae]